MDSATIDAITGLLNALGAIITALTGLFRPLALVCLSTLQRAAALLGRKVRDLWTGNTQ